MTGMPLITKIHKSLRKKRTRRIYTLLSAIALFNLGSMMFNTSYIPYLRVHGLTYGSVFLINVLNSMGQFLIYAIVLFFVTQAVDLRRYYRLATITRSASYLIAIVPLFVLAGIFFELHIVLYFIAGLAYAYWNISSSVMVYDHVRGRHKGYYIGVWTSIIGFSAVVGSFASGAISAGLGYVYTFALAIALTVASVLVLRKCY
jgi:MFS family permease